MGAILPILAQVDWVQVYIIFVTVLFFLSEALGGLPQVKSNSVYQLFMKGLTFLKGHLPNQGSKKPQGNGMKPLTKE